MGAKQSTERAVLKRSHMSDYRRKIREVSEQPFKRRNPHKLVSHRSGARVKEQTLFLCYDQLIERKESFIIGRKTLYEKLEFESEDPWMVEEIGGHREAVFVVGMKGGKAVNIRQLAQNFKIPVVETPGDIFAVGVIGVNDWTDASVAEVGDTLTPIERMQDTPPIVRNELPPDRVEESVRKKVNVEVNQRLRQLLCYGRPGKCGRRLQAAFSGNTRLHHF
jgi:hypothetical protein